MSNDKFNQPDSPDPAAALRRHAATQQATSGSGHSDPMSIEEYVEAMFGSIGNFFTLVKTKVNSFFDTGIFAHINVQKSMSDSQINQGAAMLSIRGGKLANIFSSFKPDFSKIVAPQIAGSMVDVPYSSLGGLASQDFGSTGKSASIGSGVSSDFS